VLVKRFDGRRSVILDGIGDCDHRRKLPVYRSVWGRLALVGQPPGLVREERGIEPQAVR
jgi:hypothetical protein